MNNVVWAITKKHNAFLLNDRHTGKQFSKASGNVLNLHLPSFCPLVTGHVVDLKESSKKDGTIVSTVRSKKAYKSNKIAGTYHSATHHGGIRTIVKKAGGLAKAHRSYRYTKAVTRRAAKLTQISESRKVKKSGHWRKTE